MIVSADIFVARMADQDRACHQFEEAAAAPAAKAALAHKGDRVALMLFRERGIARSRAAAELEYRDGLALQKGRCVHAVDLAMRTRRRNGKERIEQRRPALGQRAFERKQPALGNRAAIDAEPVRLAVGGQHAMTGHQDGKGISPDRKSVV